MGPSAQAVRCPLSPSLSVYVDTKR
jgi:hypothetical protein